MYRALLRIRRAAIIAALVVATELVAPTGSTASIAQARKALPPDAALVCLYESQAIYSGPLGWGWDFNYHRRLQELPNGDVYYYNGLGRKELFTAKRNEAGNIGGYDAPKGVFAELTKLKDGTWAMVFRGRYSELYDLYGRLVRMQDRNNSHMELYYDAGGRLAVVMDTMGRLYTFEYYPQDGTPVAGRLKSVTDFSDRVVEYTYDQESGDLLTAGLNERMRRYGYSTNATDLKQAHNLTSVYDPNGQVALAIVPDSEDRVTDERIAGVLVHTNAGGGLTATVTDGEQHPRSYAHYEDGHLGAVTEGSLTTVYQYYDNGLLHWVTYPMGNSVEYKYDVTSSNKLSRADLREVISTPDQPRGGQTITAKYTYDQKTNEILTVTDGRTHTTTYTRGADGNVQHVSAPEGMSLDFVRDHYGRVRFVTDALGKTTEYRYYSEAAPNGGSTTLSARSLDSSEGGYLSQVIVDEGGDNIATSFSYDPRGNLQRQTDAKGGYISYDTIDDFNQVTYMTRGGGLEVVPTTLEFDFNGNLHTRSERGVLETYEYTPANLVSTVTRSGGGFQQSARFVYDNDFKLRYRYDGKNIEDEYIYL